MIKYGFTDYLRLMWQLIKADVYVFKGSYVTRLIDYSIWVGITVGIMGYLLAPFGSGSHFGAFIAASIAGVVGIMEMYPNIAAMVMDLESERLISYRLTLPLPSWMVFLTQMLVVAIKIITVGIFMGPLGMAIVYHQFDYSLISVPKFLLLFVLAGLFFGAFTIYLASRTTGMSSLGTVWTRIMFPLWFLGGFQFSWQALHKLAPWLAYLSFANPFFYVTEGARAALLGQAGSLNYWLCIGMLIVLTIGCAWLGITRLCAKLDVV